MARVSTLGELAASIAHEVNQPLAAVVTNANACLRWMDAQPPDADEAEAAVHRIVRDANRASDVIARIRSFLRRGDLQPTAVDVEPVIAEVLGLVQADSRAQGVLMRHEPARGLPAVRVDRVQLQQVLLNLVVNALEAMAPLSDGPRTLAIGTHHEPQYDAVRVHVRDSGVGIDPGDRDALFDAFHTTKPGGMGMGLAISRSIIESHGGRLWFTRNDERGATFHFTLPVAQPG